MDDQAKQLTETLMKRPIAFQPIFKTITGNTNAALFLSQAWYWKDKANITINNKPGWFYKSAQEWEEETQLTRREQENARRICREKGFIEEKLKRANKHATCHFRVNTNRIYEEIERVSSLHESAKLESMKNKSPSLHQSAKLLDCTKAPNYLTEITRDYLPHGKGSFKTWKDAPQIYHPYFNACISKPIALHEPVSVREIKAWLETFNEWIRKGYIPEQVIEAARRARKDKKAIARPGSLTWLLNDNYSHKNGKEDHHKDTGETMLEKLAKNQRSK